MCVCVCVYLCVCVCVCVCVCMTSESLKQVPIDRTVGKPFFSVVITTFLVYLAYSNSIIMINIELKNI